MVFKREIFRIVDKKVFDQVDRFKSSSVYEYYEGVLDKFSDEGQKYFNMAVSYLIVLAPLFIMGVLLVGNITKRTELAEKRRILEEINLFSKTNTAMSGFQNAVATSFVVNNKASLQSRINIITGRALINLEDVEVSNYVEKKMANNLTESSGKINFKNLSTKQLSNLLSVLMRDKFSIAEINARKSKDNLSIEGTLEIIHFGKQ